ncbi:MAG: tetratricopeptide repeat protein [Deltaproteobacteria bacterium]
MSHRNLIRRRLRFALVLAPLLILVQAFPTAAEAGELFPGYPQAVRTQAERVVAAAEPGNGAVLAKEVRLLRIRMHAMGILSINVIPDLVFERAVREGWKKDADPILRAVREVAPFSVPMWAWLVKEDILRLSLPDFTQDFEGLSGSLERFAPSLVGFAAWLVSIVSASACWFVIWVSISLFTRARPSIEGDILRFIRVPYREYLAPLLVVLVFILPLLAGFGLAVAACIWIVLSAGYLRRGELVIMSAGIAVLVALLLCGGILGTLRAFGGDGGGGGWLGAEGNLAVVRHKDAGEAQGPLPAGMLSWMLRFEKARTEMQAGRAAVAETLWTSLAKEGRELPSVLNNRGIVRAQQGRRDEALADFEAAVSLRPRDGAALWNAYQAHLQEFNLELARKIQPEAWERVQKMAPFLLYPFDMEQEEWIASPLPVREIWKAIFQLRGEWARDAGQREYFGLFFHPLSPRISLLFLAVVAMSSWGWKLLSIKLWVHGTCRACGSRALVVRSRESSDICTPCRVKIGGGIRAGEERNRRVQVIVMHRSYVKAASLLVPGSGALWAGKEVRALAYGVVLSLALGAVTASLGGARAGDPLVSDLQSAVAVGAALLSAFIWAIGAAWGMRSFSLLQREHNIAGERI